MAKIKIAISQLWYPVTMGRYMIDALERRDDVELWTTGVFYNNWIPWEGGMHLPQKYVKVPDFPLPESFGRYSLSPQIIEQHIPWTPDLFLIIDAGLHFNSRPPGNIVALIQTDPHVFSYEVPRRYSDVSFCMQTPYMKPGDKYLPYAYDPTWCYPEKLDKIYDVALIGVLYSSRIRLVEKLGRKGLSVYFNVGDVYDEFRVKYNQSKIALNLSSRSDLTARVWETMAMALPLVTNRVPDLSTFFVENEHYLGYDSEDEAIEKILWVLDNYERAQEIGKAAFRKVKFHTWDIRMEQVLEQCKLI